MKAKNSVILVAIVLTFSSFLDCSKRVPVSYGKLESNYSCMALFPVQNETSFSPMSDLLTGYLNLEMYKIGLEEILMPSDLARIFREEGKVYFPKNFNRPLAIEYSTLLGLDGVLFGKITSPEQSRPDYQGSKKQVNLELYFLDIADSKVIWSYSEKVDITPGNYNDNMKKLSRDVVNAFVKSGFNFSNVPMPCWDIASADLLRRLPTISREMFNNLSYELAESDEASMWMNLGNIFMTIGKRSLALAQYQKYLNLNPVSPFRGEVERQVAILKK